ncbi:hypothetical protein RND71_011328 [Anisodus tanguticus]|uniref:Uncharacterized protein n=1 Tax=Anisodus tanguticus TaxID=243964 RepID=A0AAE1SEQ0_9SOLA|nr:hypothetical protein RND71_011328 [Anisodus tanguticus]
MRNSAVGPEYIVRSIIATMIYSSENCEMEGHQEREMECRSRKEMNAYIHSQVMRIRAEDSQLGEDIAKKLRERVVDQDVASVLMLSRPMLPASPLSGKTAIKSAH